MNGLSWYESVSGWMIQDASGQIAIDSHHPTDGHDDDCRCDRCDDGPMVEDGYYAGDYDGDSYPIYDAYTEDLVGHYYPDSQIYIGVE